MAAHLIAARAAAGDSPAAVASSAPDVAMTDAGSDVAMAGPTAQGQGEAAADEEGEAAADMEGEGDIQALDAAEDGAQVGACLPLHYAPATLLLFALFVCLARS